ncbi:MAG: hypothetical protein K6F67_01460 [Oscillospiraceae bacterium]|nr:hypothetical protein [Oscillospiraceae bacterium]
MRGKARKPAVSALCAALAAALLIFGSMLPTGKIAFSAVAGLATAAALIECGYLYSVFEFIVAAALGLLLAPSKAPAVMFCLLFGWYPIVKSLVEKLKSRAAEYLLKLAVILAVIGVFFVLVRLGVGELSLPDHSKLVVAGAAVIAFFAYDFCFSGLIRVYIRRVRGRMK